MTCFKMKSGENLHSFCKKNGIIYSTIFTRIDRMGLTPEEAIAFKKYDRKKGIIKIDGLTYKEYTKIHHCSHTEFYKKAKK